MLINSQIIFLKQASLHDMRANYEAFLEDAVSLLHPDLRPVPPQPNCSDSMQIYQNHRKVEIHELLYFIAI